MNLDELRKHSKRINAPMDIGATETPSFNTFVERLRERDAKEKRTLKAAMIITPAVGVTIAVTAAHQHSFGPAMIAAVYFLIAGLAWIKSRWLARVQYEGPTEEFLRDAEERYKFWRMKDTLIAIPGLAILAIGGSLIVKNTAQRYFGPDGQTYALIAYAIFFALVVVLGFVFSWGNWKKENEELMEEIRRMRRELLNG